MEDLNVPNRSINLVKWAAIVAGLVLVLLLAAAAIFLLWGPVPKTQAVSLGFIAKEKRHSEQGIYITENVAQLPVRFKTLAAGFNEDGEVH